VLRRRQATAYALTTAAALVLAVTHNVNSTCPASWVNTDKANCVFPHPASPLTDTRPRPAAPGPNVRPA